MAKDILKEAIADAKAVREVALANAKAALEEAFTPKLQSMLSAKLSEELEEEVDEMYYGEDDKEDKKEGYHMGEDDPDDKKEEGYHMGEDDPDDKKEEGMHSKMGEDPDKKDEAYHGDDKMGEDEMEEEVDLEGILRELELEEGEAEEPVAEGEEEIAEGDKEELEETSPIYKAEEANRVGYKADYVNEKENFDIDALLEELEGLEEKKDDDDKMEEGKKDDDDKMEEGKKDDDEKNESVNPLQAELDEVKNELEETQKALEVSKTQLSEVNLLNSKLLYVNKIFKANQLNESQKLRVVDTLDQAGTVKEAKLIYETIKNTFTISSGNKQTKKSSIKEGLGMASKATGKSTAPKKEVISESNDMMKRFQKLANIKINQ